MNGFTLEHRPGDADRPAVVLMSGMFAGSWIWEMPYEALAADGWPVARIVEPIAELPDISGSVAKVRTALQEACASAGISEMILCGVSMGAAVALDLAMAEPGRVRALVLTGTPGLTPDPDLGIAPDHRSGSLMFSDDFPTRLADSLVYGGVAASSAQEFQRVEAVFTDKQSMLGISRGIRAIRRYNIKAALKHVTCPIMNIWGAEDRTTPVEVWKDVVETHPNHRLALLERCGHVPMVEKPYEYTELLRGFVDEYAPAAA
ncbi:alpha/beta hydrolase [Nonomuraea sp. NPDC052116]|uniref:alpha/beta fold hydrolase n=1 Tax=Nonomuraea sp. NPDC052116 TaxID=3155665 RepID=UPI003417EE75